MRPIRTHLAYRSVAAQRSLLRTAHYQACTPALCARIPYRTAARPHRRCAPPSAVPLQAQPAHGTDRTVRPAPKQANPKRARSAARLARETFTRLKGERCTRRTLCTPSAYSADLPWRRATSSAVRLPTRTSWSDRTHAAVPRPLPCMWNRQTRRAFAWITGSLQCAHHPACFRSARHGVHR